MSTAIEAYAGEETSVIYEYDDGRVEKWSEGSRSWRNRNPGNVRYVEANDWQGQIGYAGGFACFSDGVWGMRAIRKILEAYGRRGMTLEQGIATYAPASENNTEAYVRSVESETGISRKALIRMLNEREMNALLEAIKKHEGYEEGLVTEIKARPTKKTVQPTRYVWRTMGDDKVRAGHAERAGLIFEWANPPSGGHPGEAYGCRCWAESIPDELEQGLGTIFRK